MAGIAYLSSVPNYTVFRYGDRVLRFRAPYSLERYTAVKKWERGCLTVDAKYAHNSGQEEEYIDLIPVLENLYMDPQAFLKPIKEVRLAYD